ncbi:MAG: hypothetical protein ACOYNS_02120 [Bacteroidota bacterium]
MSRSFSIISGSLLLMVLMFQSVGYVVSYTLWISKNRHDVKMNIIKGLPDDAFTIITRPLNDPSSPLEFEDDEEFKLYGEMYDIVRTEVRNDSITYVAFHDEKETSLNISLATAVDERTSMDPAAMQSTLKLLAFGQLQYLDPVIGIFSIPEYRVLYSRQNQELTAHPSFAVITPPPKIDLFI